MQRIAHSNSGIKFRPDSSCVLWLPGQDDAQSATIRDRSGYGNNGTITGATWERLSSGLWVNSFDGTGDVTKATPTLNATTELTIAFWLYQGVDNHWASLLVMGYLIDVNTFGVWWGDSEGAFLITRLAGVEKRSAAIRPSVNTWVNMAFTYSSGTGISYLNGAASAPVVDMANPLPTPLSDNTLYIGKDRSGDYLLTGKMGLYRIFNRTLSAVEVAAIYQSERSLFGV